jgi:hypothetical protein
VLFGNRFEKFSSSGTFITKWGSRGSGDGQFNDPWGIAVDASGNVFVADTGNDRVQVFAPVSGEVNNNGSADLFNQSSCFIATAAYGSSMAPDVMLLRQFRDRYLLTNPIGKAFVHLYYRLSPPLARMIAGNELLRSATRAALTPVIFSVKQPADALIIVITTAGVLIFWRRTRKRRQRAALFPSKGFD